MAGNFKKEDLRIKKTYKALTNAITIMLNQKNFNQITVNDLCGEALISRATFYVHFNDKYDLLKYWLSNLSNFFIKDLHRYEKMETNINQFVRDNQNLIANIFSDANNETLELVNEFVSSIIKAALEKYIKKPKPTDIILSDFCTGGIVNMILLQVKMHFPLDNKMMTPFLFYMLKCIMEWNGNQEN